MKLLDKIKNKVKIDKNLIVFLIVLMLIGISVGSIFVTILNDSDKALINEHINLYLDNIETGQVDGLINFKTNIISNLIYIIIIWLLGISVIGIPIIITMFFAKSFILGFSIGSILSIYKTKGILFTVIYVFPSNVLNLLFLLLLTMYSLSFAIYLIYAIFKKKTIDFKIMINKYLIILLIVIISSLIFTLYDSFILPNLIKSILKFIR